MAALATEKERQGSGVPMKTKGGPSGTLALWDTPQSHREVPKGCEGTQRPWGIQEDSGARASRPPPWRRLPPSDPPDKSQQGPL